jgi:Na+/H+ antiporter NhaD/arsenite permease-like protein
METIEYFQDFLEKIGAPNFLAIGIVVIVLWLLISGIRKGLKKGKRDKDSENNNDHKGED